MYAYIFAYSFAHLQIGMHREQYCYTDMAIFDEFIFTLALISEYKWLPKCDKFSKSWCNQQQYKPHNHLQSRASKFETHRVVCCNHRLSDRVWGSGGHHVSPQQGQLTYNSDMFRCTNYDPCLKKVDFCFV